MEPADSVAVLIPVLARPDRVAPLLASLRGSQADVPLRAVFLLSPDDHAEARAVVQAELDRGDFVVSHTLDRPPGRGDYSRKINLGYRRTLEPWLFLAADDLCFCHGWADHAIRCARKHGKRVIGTNDLGNDRVIAGTHSTHTLVARSYADELGTRDAGPGGVPVDVPGVVLHEGYWHNYVDDEFVRTARARNEFEFARLSQVEHMHPHWHKAGWDATYSRGQEHFNADGALLESRRRLWRGW